MPGSFLSQLGLSGQAASLQAQYPNLPAGLLEAQAAQEGGVNLATGAAITNRSGHTGLAQTSASTAADPGYGVTPLANSQDASSSLNFMAAYDSALITRYGSADAGLSHYSGGAYTATSLGVGSSLADPFAGGASNTNSAGVDTSTMAGLTPAQTAAAGANVAAGTAELGVPSPSAIVAKAQGAIAEYFVRGAVLVLGFIFVAAGLMMFRNPVSDAVKGAAKAIPLPV